MHTVDYSNDKADQFIAKNKRLLKQDFRLNYHLMAEYGWMNDPNGFVQYKGDYHLFYQHYPYDVKWGPMHWGHAVSRDLVKWTYAPIALAPDREYDRGGCFSGSAIEKDGKLHLLYTGHVVIGPDKDRDYVQTQNLVNSEDGLYFEKWAGNPVVRLEQIPQAASRKDFRDPKVFWRGGFYYMVLGSNDNGGRGQILLYRSANLKHWEYVNVLAKSDGSMGDNWECPDLFNLQGRDILMFSPQRMPPRGHDYRNLHSTMYMNGKFDPVTGKFHTEDYEQMDAGFDFYAPQSTADAEGRRIVVGWMDTWEAEMPTQKGHGWAGAMTLPREVELKGERLYFHPIREIERHRRNPYLAQGIRLDGVQDLGVEGDSYELAVRFEARQAEEFGLKLRVGEAEETVLAYRPSDRLFRMDREHSGIGPGGVRQTEIVLENGCLTLRIFVDRSSVEVFLQDGRKVMTCRIYPGPRSKGIQAFSHGGSCILNSLKKWDLVVD